MTLPQKTPATIITGFLGAGKTTLIRHILENAGNRRLALVINEFGDVGVDGDILRACGVKNCPEENIIELANGCLCCTVADDFIPAIETLLMLKDPPDHIIIETSGLALPKPLVKAFDWPSIRSKLTVDGVLAVVDARAVVEGRFADPPETADRRQKEIIPIDHDNPLEEVFEDQLNCADLIILNKVDLITQQQKADISAEIKKHSRSTAVLTQTEHGRISPEIILGLSAAAENDLLNRPSFHDLEDQHDHDDFDSFIIEIGDVADPSVLFEKLMQATREHDLLRIKGFIHVAQKPMRLLVQGVGGRLNSYYDRPWKPDEARRSQLVIIGLKGLDFAAISRIILSS
ncbi:cobalamin biosynthesis protein CobW [Methylocystaceae bacterium]|nr:cobalamin biosynthesis protein CobW [Methylocystaceae bacterium]